MPAAPVLQKGDYVAICGDSITEPFKKVSDAVRRQQNFETPMIKSVLHGFSDLRNTFPEKQALYDSMRASLVAADEELRTAAVASVVPVKHEIRIGQKRTGKFTAPCPVPAFWGSASRAFSTA